MILKLQISHIISDGHCQGCRKRLSKLKYISKNVKIWKTYINKQGNSINMKRYTTSKSYLFQLWGPIMLCLYSGDPFSCDLSFCIWIYIRRSPQIMLFLSRLSKGMYKVNTVMPKCFKMIFPRLEVWLAENLPIRLQCLDSLGQSPYATYYVCQYLYYELVVAFCWLTEIFFKIFYVFFPI